MLSGFKAFFARSFVLPQSMPRSNRKATMGRSNFVSAPKGVDSGSVYNSSSDEDRSSASGNRHVVGMTRYI